MTRSNRGEERRPCERTLNQPSGETEMTAPAAVSECVAPRCPHGSWQWTPGEAGDIGIGSSADGPGGHRPPTRAGIMFMRSRCRRRRDVTGLAICVIRSNYAARWTFSLFAPRLMMGR